MPRTCTICGHPKREEIDRTLLTEESFRNIAERFGTSVGALVRHKADHIPAHLAQAKEAEEITNADTLVAELRRIMARIGMLFDACDRWLRDPDNPDRYDVGPRAEDVIVTYLEPVGDKEIRRKARLSNLLPQVEKEHGVTVTLVEVKHADPRKLLLEASGRLAGQLELLARLLGELQENQVNILILPEWLQICKTMMESLAAYPDARIAVAEALWRLDHANGHSA